MSGVRGIGVVVAGLLVSISAAGCSESSEAKPAATAVLEENLSLIESLVIDPQAEPLVRDDDAGPQPGGRGTLSSVVYPAPGSLLPAAVIDLVTDEMSGWTVLCQQSRPTRSMIDLRRGDAWVSISAGNTNLDGTLVPTYSIAVNALDGDLMERDFISHQPCDNDEAAQG